MIVSVVERQTWKRCRRKWQLTSDRAENLQSIVLVPALKLGSMVQETLSEWTESPSLDPIACFAKLSADALTDIKAQYRESVGAVISDIELDSLYELIQLGMAMVTNYKEYYGSPIPSGYTAIQTEQRVIVAIPDTYHWECNECGWIPQLGDYELLNKEGWDWNIGNIEESVNKCGICKGNDKTVTWQPHYLRATIDTLTRDSKGVLWPLERKTYGQRPDKNKLQHDDQMLAYDWAMNQLFPGQVGGMLYDGMWKRGHVPNSKTKGRKTVIDDLFYRDIFIRPPEEKEEFGALLTKEVLDMAHAIQNDLIYINRQWQGCWDCSVSKLCDAMSRGEDVQYVRDTFFQQRPSGILLEEAEEDE